MQNKMAVLDLFFLLRNISYSTIRYSTTLLKTVMEVDFCYQAVEIAKQNQSRIKCLGIIQLPLLEEPYILQTHSLLVLLLALELVNTPTTSFQEKVMEPILPLMLPTGSYPL